MQKFIFILLALFAAYWSYGQGQALQSPLYIRSAEPVPLTYLSDEGSYFIQGGGTLIFQGNTISAPHDITNIVAFEGGTYDRSAGSYLIDGYASSNGSSAIVLPIGEGAMYMPVTVPAGKSLTADWSGSMVPVKQSYTIGDTTYTISTGTYNVIAGSGTSGIGFTVPAGSTATTVLYSNNGGNTFQKLGIVNNTYSLPAGPGNIYFAKVSSVLPVVLTNFRVTADAACNMGITWASATEINSSKYVIEYSSNGSSYADLQEVQSKNNANGSSYSIVINRSQLSSGNGLIRLKMLDKDGKVAYSDAKPVTISCAAIAIRVQPNPITSFIRVVNITGIHNTIHIYSVTGQLMATKITNNSTETLSASNYAQGTYLVIVKNDKGKVIASEKVVK